MLLEANAKELKYRHVHGQENFEKVRTSILNVAVVERLEQMNRGAKDMDIDHVGQPEEAWITSEWTAWCEKMADEEDRKQYEDANYLGKGKGKGKQGGGKAGGRGKDGGKNSKGADGKGKGKGKETRNCWWCLKDGHLKAQCRSFLAGKPKAVRIASLDEDKEWEEDCSCVDIAADALDEESEDSSDDSDEAWTVAEGRQRQEQRVAAAQRLGHSSGTTKLAPSGLQILEAAAAIDPWNQSATDPWTHSAAAQNHATSIFDAIKLKQEETKKRVEEIMKPKTHQSASSPLSPPTFAQQSPEAPRLRESPEAPRPSIGMPPAQMPEVVPPPAWHADAKRKEKAKKGSERKSRDANGIRRNQYRITNERRAAAHDARHPLDPREFRPHRRLLRRGSKQRGLYRDHEGHRR